MNNVLLISYKSLTGNTDLGENIDPKILQPLILEVQDIKIQVVIGTLLYDKLKKLISEDTLAGDYKILVDDHIKPALINYILADLPYKSKYRFTNIGLVERTSENSASVSVEELKQLSDFYRSRAAFYSERLTSFLCANTDKYPEYKNTDSADDIQAKPQHYDTGIYL